MRFADDEKTVLAVNEHVSLRGIPASVHTYQVNGRTSVLLVFLQSASALVSVVFVLGAWENGAAHVSVSMKSNED